MKTNINPVEFPVQPGGIIKMTFAQIKQLISLTIQEYERVRGPTDKLWLSRDEAMEMLDISSKTTLQKLRNEGEIEYSEVSSKKFLYNRDSIMAFLERNAKKSFH